jgi:PadR family transcriptional regulator, regulatory protein PadR
MHEPRITHATLKVFGLFMRSPRRQLSGADIIRETKVFSGTLYPMLARLELAGMLTSAWEDVDPSEAGRPRRRLYRITALGQNAANKAFREMGVPAPGRAATSGGRA